MSSLARARSLRKPDGPTALPPPRERPNEASHDPNRNASPSRLPTKPSSRPASTMSPARSTSVRLNRPAVCLAGKEDDHDQQDTGGHTAAAAAVAPPARKDTQRYPPLSSATRPTSMVLRPTSAGSTAAAPAATRRTTPMHTRAKSTATAGTSAARTTVQPPATGQERKSRSRPPSRDPTSSLSSAAAAPGTPKRRAVSVDKPAAPTTPITTAAATTQPRLQHRPAFTTLQQRFSPAKTSSPKPATASFTQPPRPASPSKLPANVAVAAETARLQTTLLQLHLLHQAAGPAETRWRASAQATLGARFRGVRDNHRALVDREAAAIEADNLAALHRWAGVGATLDEKVRALDAAVSGVWGMSEPGGKYARAVRKFERWVERVMDLEEARENGTLGCLLATSGGRGSTGGSVEDALFVPELDPAWADDCAAMARKLENWQEQLDSTGSENDLGPQDRATSLGRMLEGTRRLLVDMLAELAAMEEIRQAAVVREENWIEAMNRDEEEDKGDVRPRAGAVWRAV
ncbi:hypothetical protein A9K55_002019 [Cordyceps militaris]|uniref:Aga1 a-agglutinin anchor subunit n=1 Tax=Cordyceps militaris TaxID=73501 RepID=A0A2H4SQM0_CORMI|nr:hypothetical protein A9K55_002019 [Cordyceps militaris]